MQGHPPPLEPQWNGNIDLYNYLLGPVTLIESDRICSLYASRPVDLSDQEFASATCSIINACRPANVLPLSPTHIINHLDSLACLVPHRLNTDDVDAERRAAGIGAAACPVILFCLDCGGALEQHLVPRSPWFFPATGRPVVGKLYEKRCRTCNITYSVNGYSRESALPPSGSTRSPKHPYPLLYEHPTWDQLSAETVFEKDLYRHLDAHLLYNHTSFSAFTKVFNHAQRNGT